MNNAERGEILCHGDIEVVGRVSGSSNQALLVTVTLDGVSLDACYKAERGERPLWDFPDGLWRREVAAYELDQILGQDLVPVTVARDDAPFGPGSLQWWVDDNHEDHYFTLLERPELESWFRALAVFDAVANNADRKAGHIIFDNHRCWAIDNGLSFHVEPKLRTVVWEFAGHEIDEVTRATLSAFAEGDGGELITWLRPNEVAATQQRARELAIAGILPDADLESEWPPYPWPLV
jgi:hypothetical protein